MKRFHILSGLLMASLGLSSQAQQPAAPAPWQQGMTAEQAIRQSKIIEQFPEIDLAVNKVGVFGKLASLETALRHMDRVEIYRALIADPKEVRRQRAAEGKVMRKGGGEAEE